VQRRGKGDLFLERGFRREGGEKNRADKRELEKVSSKKEPGESSLEGGDRGGNSPSKGVAEARHERGLSQL